MTKSVVSVLVAAAFAVSSASAASLPSCSLFAGYTLTNLLGESCVVGDKLFSNFNSQSSASVTDTVTFEPLAAIANNPGVEFAGLAAGANESVFFNVSYDVEVLPKNPFVIQTGEFSIPTITFSGAAANLTGSQNYCEGGAGNAETCIADGGNLFSANILATPPAASFTSATTVPLTLTLAVSDDLTLTAGSTGASIAQIDQRFAQVATPEPATFMLLGSGLLLVSGVVRRRLKSDRE